MFFKNNNNTKYILFIIAAVLFVWAVSQIKEIALIFFGSFVIACSLNPLADKFSKKMPRVISSLLVIVAAIFLIFAVFVPVGIMAFKEIKSLIVLLPDFANNVITQISLKSFMGHKISSYINYDDVVSNVSLLAGNILDKSWDITLCILDAITVILSMIMVIFYLIYEKNQINASTLKLFPPKLKKRAAEIITTIETKVGGYVIAQILSMSTVGFITMIGLFVCKIDYALLLGVIAGLLDIIPIVGPTIALLFGISAALAKGAIWIIPTVAVYLTGQWISNQLVRPIVFGKFMELHPLIVLFSFFIAAKFLGVWGVILAPAIAAMLLTLFDELYIKTINEKIRKQDE